MEYCTAIKKNARMPFAATCIDLEMIILTELSQKEKNKYHTISHVQYTKMTQLNLYTKLNGIDNQLTAMMAGRLEKVE